jgi:rhodanese-related sulfurtransferase
MNQQQLQHYTDKLEFETDVMDTHTAMERGEPIIVIDARSPDAYQREHIPGAISLHHRLMSIETTQHLDKSKLVVVYCDGIGCNASTSGALKMTRLGFRVREMMGGLDWWKRSNLKTQRGAAAA